MKILAVDTSTSFASIAVAVGEQFAAGSLINTNRTLSARLVLEIERLLAASDLEIADIDIFASSTGPGSFTGVRGGIATIQGLALATGKPCAGFSSLAMLAMNFPLSAQLVCPMLDARKSEVYAALYDCSTTIPSARINDCVLPPAMLVDLITAHTSSQVIFAGDGAVRYRDLITGLMGNRAIIAPFHCHCHNAANGIQLAIKAFRQGKLLQPSQLLPLYLRASDAELMKNRK